MCPKIKVVQQRHRLHEQKLPGPLEAGPEHSMFQNSVSCAVQAGSDTPHNESS